MSKARGALGVPIPRGPDGAPLRIRRDDSEICILALEFCELPQLRAHVSRHCNVGFDRIGDYLAALEKQGWVEQTKINGRNLWIRTAKGTAKLEEIKKDSFNKHIEELRVPY